MKPVIAFDISGSYNVNWWPSHREAVLRAVGSRRFKNPAALLIFFDTRIVHGASVTRGTVDRAFAAATRRVGGGCDVKPLLNVLNPNIERLIIFTDGNFGYPENPPPCPTIWVNYGPGSFPYDTMPGGPIVDIQDFRG